MNLAFKYGYNLMIFQYYLLLMRAKDEMKGIGAGAFALA